jgi:hypothetical protein
VRRRWPPAQLAAAAVLVLALVGGLLVLRARYSDGRPAVLEASHGIAFGPGGSLIETLLSARIETPDSYSGWTPVSLERWLFQPGDAGLIVPPLDGPQWVTADRGTLIAIVDGIAHPIKAGDSIIVPAGRDLRVQNAGAVQATILRGVVAAGFALEEFDRAAITRRVELDTSALEALPPGNTQIDLTRLTIPPGSTLPPEALGGLDWFGVVSGRLGLSLEGTRLPDGWRPGEERVFEAFAPLPLLSPGTRLTFRNAGDQPLILLRLTATPERASAAPPALFSMWRIAAYKRDES